MQLIMWIVNLAMLGGLVWVAMKIAARIGAWLEERDRGNERRIESEGTAGDAGEDGDAGADVGDSEEVRRRKDDADVRDDQKN